MLNTANYGLKKPELTDYVNVSVFNDNADIIDATLKEHEDIIINLKGYELQGSANFNSTTGIVISHSIGNTAYNVQITASQNPNGYLGEVWVEKANNSFVVKCSGTATTSFNYIVFSN